MKILLATDGSDYSATAARKCRELISGVSKAQIKIVTVIDNFTPMATEPFVTSQEFLANMESQMRENAEGAVASAEEILLDGGKTPDIKTEILLGSPKKMIIREAEKWKPDLIVVGSHGHGFWERAVLGSVSSAVVHRAKCSVLVVKSGGDQSDG